MTVASIYIKSSSSLRYEYFLSLLSQRISNIGFSSIGQRRPPKFIKISASRAAGNINCTFHVSESEVSGLDAFYDIDLDTVFDTVLVAVKNMVDKNWRTEHEMRNLVSHIKKYLPEYEISKTLRITISSVANIASGSLLPDALIAAKIVELYNRVNDSPPATM
jgi:hypothetical protein